MTLPPAKWIMFQNTIGDITFIITSIDSGTSICSEQHEVRFVRWVNCSPLCTPPWNLLLTPPKSFSDTMCHENIVSHRSPCMKNTCRWLITIWKEIHLSPWIWRLLSYVYPKGASTRHIDYGLGCLFSVGLISLLCATCIVVMHPMLIVVLQTPICWAASPWFGPACRYHLDYDVLL